MAKAQPKPFVLLNIPKTGSIYTSVLLQNADLLSLMKRPSLRDALSHRPRLAEALCGMLTRMRRLQILRFGYMNSWEHHIFYCRLPERLRSYPAVSVLREPLSWYVSRYLQVTFPGGPDHSQHVLQDLRTIKRLLNTQQDPRHQNAAFFLEQHLGGKLTPQAWLALNFDGFLYFMRHFFCIKIIWAAFGVRVPTSFPLGPLGCRALSFVHRDPKRLFAMTPEQVEAYFADGRWRRDLARVWFLRYNQLQQDLRCVMLERLGYDEETLDAAARLMPARLNAADPVRKERTLRELEQKPQLREEILRNERLYAEHLLPLAGAFRNDDLAPHRTRAQRQTRAA